MLKVLVIIPVFLLSFCSFAQKREITKVQWSFKWFKSYDTQYTINYNTDQLTLVDFDYLKKESFRKNYKFSKNNFENLKKALEENTPNSEVKKITDAFDGGGFTLTYYFSDGKSTKIIIGNPYRKDPKYNSDFKIIDALFEFAYSIVNDDKGISSLDNTYEPYFDGLPIRKTSDNPTMYKLWGNISGNASTNPKFIEFLNSLSKTKCIIIDTDSKLSWSYQDDILVQFIIRNSNIKFANMSYLKHTREYILKIRAEIEAAKSNNQSMDKFKRNSSAITYLEDSERIDKWLELINWNKSIEDLKLNCR